MAAMFLWSCTFMHGSSADEIVLYLKQIARCRHVHVRDVFFDPAPQHSSDAALKKDYSPSLSVANSAIAQMAIRDESLRRDRTGPSVH